MEEFQLQIQPPALDEIQKAIDYYDSKRKGLGEEFEDELNKHFYSILNTKYFQIRYDEVRCLPLKIFPYMMKLTDKLSSELFSIRNETRIFGKEISENWTRWSCSFGNDIF